MPVFIIVGYVSQILGRGGFFGRWKMFSPNPWAAPKMPILNRVNEIWLVNDVENLVFKPKPPLKGQNSFNDAWVTFSDTVLRNILKYFYSGRSRETLHCIHILLANVLNQFYERFSLCCKRFWTKSWVLEPSDLLP